MIKRNLGDRYMRRGESSEVKSVGAIKKNGDSLKVVKRDISAAMETNEGEEVVQKFRITRLELINSTDVVQKMQPVRKMSQLNYKNRRILKVIHTESAAVRNVLKRIMGAATVECSSKPTD